VSIIVWPLFFFFGLLGACLGRKEEANYARGGFIGLVIAAVLYGAVFLYAQRTKIHNENRRRELSNCEEPMRDAQDALSYTQNEISRIEKEIKEALASIHS
jgi:septal ring factor EnvC (AmiA/AmiB activator)